MCSHKFDDANANKEHGILNGDSLAEGEGGTEKMATTSSLSNNWRHCVLTLSLVFTPTTTITGAREGKETEQDNSRS